MVISIYSICHRFSYATKISVREKGILESPNRHITFMKSYLITRKHPLRSTATCRLPEPNPSFRYNTEFHRDRVHRTVFGINVRLIFRTSPVGCYIIYIVNSTCEFKTQLSSWYLWLKSIGLMADIQPGLHMNNSNRILSNSVWVFDSTWRMYKL